MLPYAFELPGGWFASVNPKFSWKQDVLDLRGYHFEFSGTTALAHALRDSLYGWVQFLGIVSAERGTDWLGAADVGLTYLASKNIQLDAGISFGVTKPAIDINPYLGISFRF
jgi:hypothetical protein